MYHHIEPIQEVAVSVLEPVASQVVRYIINRLGLEKTFGNNIVFNSPIEASTKTTDNANNRITIDNRIVCNVNPILSPEATPFENITGYDITSEGYPMKRIENQFPIFSDIINKMYLFSMDRPGALGIECNFYFADSVTAYQVANRVFTQFANNMTIPVTDLMFDYPINESLLNVMYQLYKLTEFPKNPKNNFISYLKEGSKNHITFLVNRELPNNGQVVIQRTLRHCMIKVEFGDQGVNPDKRGKAPLKFTNQMTLTVQFSQPSNLVLKYPMVINNTMIPITLIPEHGIPDKPPVVVYPEISVNNFMKYLDDGVPENWLLQFWDEEYLKTLDPSLWPDALKTAWVHKNRHNMVHFPPFDNWLPPSNIHILPNYYNPIVTIAVQIDPLTGEARLHLYNDIQPVAGVATSVIDFIRDNPIDIFFVGLPYMLAVYRDEDLLDVSQTWIEGNWLVIKSKKLQAIHRVVIYNMVKMISGTMAPELKVILFDIKVLADKG